MVGFGSSLRLAQRPGWEGGYLDYETLKLLLSQIEAYYEEGEAPPMMDDRISAFIRGGSSSRQHHRMGGHDGTAASGPDGEGDGSGSGIPTGGGAGSTGHGHHAAPPAIRRRSGDGNRNCRATQHRSPPRRRSSASIAGCGDNKHGKVKDYRRDIFIESDSDAAFCSVVDETDCMEDDDEEAYYHDHPRQDGGGVGNVGNGPIGVSANSTGYYPEEISAVTTNNKPFTLSYSHELPSSSEETHDDDDASREAGCGAHTFSSWKLGWGGGTEKSSGQLDGAAKGRRRKVAVTDHVGGSNAPGNGTGKKVKHHRQSASGSSYGSSAAAMSAHHARHNTYGADEEDDYFGTVTATASSTSNSFFLSRTSSGGLFNDGSDDNDRGGQYSGGFNYGAVESGLQHPRYPPSPQQQSSSAYDYYSSNVGTAFSDAGIIGLRSSADYRQQTEFSSLLQPNKPHTPPKQHYYPSVSTSGLRRPTEDASSTASPISHNQPSAPAIAAGAPSWQTVSTQQQKVLIQERQQQRRLRRMRRKRKKRQQHRGRKVPMYLRVAHSKARAVTERFLGLLRAETEKVLLFAQARLGELADTAGSLRFLIEDDYNGASTHHSRSHNLHGSRSYEYPLSDGGLHPSASSSDEDGVPGYRHHAWSDSSDDGSPCGTSHQQQQLLDDMASGGNASVSGLLRTFTQESGYGGGSAAARRQIAHYTEIRKNRPVFQRNDHILGEDLLFLSAIEEADGFTAVGVELLHVLKFICVNLIAVRKICRKHDRLLMNRMLGGYYHRITGSSRKGEGRNNSHLGDANTLGGLVAQSSGDIYEAHPAWIGQMNHYKLVGVYDKKIQKLANSRTVQVVSSCLALALSEYEVARSRAHALTRLNSASTLKMKRNARDFGGNYKHPDDSLLLPVLESDAEGPEGPPSTASSMSLTRLRFTVTSIFALREAARYKVSHFGSYISRSAMTFTGHPVAGEGLDGCSRETLDFLVSYNPDSALLLDSSVLFEGLEEGQWLYRPMSQVMVSTLAAATIPDNVNPETAALSLLPREGKIVVCAVSVVPESRTMSIKQLLPGFYSPKSILRPNMFPVPEFPEVILRLNVITSLLYMMNYFVAHATTRIFVTGAGAAPCHLATIIGAPNLAAILAALFHCFALSRERTRHLRPSQSLKLLRRLFLLSSFFGVTGGVVHGVAVVKDSVHLAVLGRFLFGFSSTEILSRHVVCMSLPSHIVRESTRLIQFRVIGMILGLLFGSLAEAMPIVINNVSIRVVQVTSWTMVTLWFLHFVRICCQFRMQNVSGIGTSCEDDSIFRKGPSVSGDNDSDSSKSDIGTTSSDLNGSSSSLAADNPLTATYGKPKDGLEGLSVPSTDLEPKKMLGSPPAFQTRKRSAGPCQQWKTFMRRLKKLLRYHVGISLSFMVFLYTSFGQEVFFTATPIIASRYFGWSGTHTGLLLGFLAGCILPMHFVCERIARKYEERTVVKRCLRVVAIGLFIMVNWLSLFTLASHVPNLLTDADSDGGPSVYDWNVGMIQYVIGLVIAFGGMTAVDGSNLSLLSKMSPQRLRGVVLNIGTLMTFLSLFARLAANLQILMVDLSHKLINTDIVNALVIPIFLFSFVLMYFWKKHFFFLM